MSAALVTVGVMLSGCASADGGEEGPTTSPAISEPTGNPWDLPIEQRPALFDPCAEIPVEAIEAGVGSAVEPADKFRNSRPGELISCGWSNREVNVVVLSTWKSKDEYLADPAFRVLKDGIGVHGRASIQITESQGDPPRTCIELIFTPLGTIWTGLDLTTSLFEFNGKPFAETCAVLENVLPSVTSHFPKGDIQ